MKLRHLLCLIVLCAAPQPLCADPPDSTPTRGAPPEPPVEAADLSVSEIAARARRSVVVITVAGRDGGRQGLGTGFVVSRDGLIATNLHVIGEARPVAVQLADGRELKVVRVHATDRAADLAIVQVEAEDLVPLALGDSAGLPQGARVVALGNPQGLRHSVVEGVLSSKREIAGRPMLQVAIPIEPGNSGGPLVDAQGRAVGIVTMKSAVTENLGFAVPIAALRPLLARPNPIPMERWLTIGALDPRQWMTRFGGRWQQRAGRILVSEPGRGFGGRALCLSTAPPPELPYEVAVNVRLDDEAGAAGLVFHADGGEKHYGFYPSAGKLRLTRFAGASVYSWKVLFNERSEHYRPGEWNELKVRLEPGKILCYVNDQLVVTSTDSELPRGRIGLAKFRQTEAEFKRFRAGRAVAPSRPSAEVATRLRAAIDALPGAESRLPAQLAPLTRDPAASQSVLEQQAATLQRRSEELRRLARDVRVQAIAAGLGKVTGGDDAEIDLAHAALLIARLDEEDIEVAAYLKEIDRLADDVRRQLAGDDDGNQAAADGEDQLEPPDDSEKADEAARLAALTRYLFQENGFHGSRTDYYHRANSYLNRLLDDREGLPITLSVLFMELGRRLDLNLEGVGLPGHFVVRHVPRKGEPQLIDVFDGGKPLTRDDATRLVRTHSGATLTEAHLRPATRREIVKRMLANLIGVAEGADDKEALLGYLEAGVAVDPADVQLRGMRSVVRAATGRRAAAIADLDWFLEHEPEGIDLDQIDALRRRFESGG